MVLPAVLALLVVGGVAVAQAELNSSATTSAPALHVRLTLSPEVSGDGTIRFTVQPLFRGVSDQQAADAAEASSFDLYGVASGRFNLASEVPGVSVLGEPGIYAAPEFVWSGISPANDLPTSELVTVAVGTSSMANGCAGVRREINIAIARPGQPVYQSSDDFVNNPLNGHNLIATFALNDCIPELFYIESVGGEPSVFQSRLSVAYWDDGAQTTVAFYGAPPTMAGYFTVSAIESQVDFTYETAFGYMAGPYEFAESAIQPLSLDTMSYTMDEVATMPPDVPGLVPEMEEASAAAPTTSSTPPTTTAAASSTQAVPPTELATEAGTEGSASVVSNDGILGGFFLGLVILGVSILLMGLLWTLRIRRKPKDAIPTDSDTATALPPPGLLPAEGMAWWLTGTEATKKPLSDIPGLLAKTPMDPFMAVQVPEATVAFDGSFTDLRVWMVNGWRVPDEDVVVPFDFGATQVFMLDTDRRRADLEWSRDPRNQRYQRMGRRLDDSILVDNTYTYGDSGRPTFRFTSVNYGEDDFELGPTQVFIVDTDYQRAVDEHRDAELAREFLHSYRRRRLYPATGEIQGVSSRAVEDYQISRRRNIGVTGEIQDSSIDSVSEYRMNRSRISRTTEEFQYTSPRRLRRRRLYPATEIQDSSIDSVGEYRMNRGRISRATGEIQDSSVSEDEPTGPDLVTDWLVDGVVVEKPPTPIDLTPRVYLVELPRPSYEDDVDLEDEYDPEDDSYEAYHAWAEAMIESGQGEAYGLLIDISDWPSEEGPINMDGSAVP